jgi:N-acetylmuramoyl-L-alanine amidase
MWRLRSAKIYGLIGAAVLALPARSGGPEQIQRTSMVQVQTPSAPSPQRNNSAPSTPLQSQPATGTEEAPGVTVILDPAHGGADLGARGPTGLAESDVVLDFARAARIALEAQRFRVLLTREGNQDPSFDNRSAMVNGLSNAIFVSLHVSSGGLVGTARTYYYIFPPDKTLNPNVRGTTLPQNPGVQQTPDIGAHNNLIEWDHAQRSSVDLSRQLAYLTQTELARHFRGSPEIPNAAPVRQLRTIAAPAIAIELSRIDVTDAKRLDQMAQPLAEAIGRAVAEFHYPLSSPAANSNGGF